MSLGTIDPATVSRNRLPLGPYNQVASHPSNQLMTIRSRWWVSRRRAGLTLLGFRRPGEIHVAVAGVVADVAVHF